MSNFIHCDGQMPVNLDKIIEISLTLQKRSAHTTKSFTPVSRIYFKKAGNSDGSTYEVWAFKSEKVAEYVHSVILHEHSNLIFIPSRIERNNDNK